MWTVPAATRGSSTSPTWVRVRRSTTRCPSGSGRSRSVTRVSSPQLDVAPRGLTEVVRASPHYVTSDDDLDRLLTAVRLTA